MEWSAALSYVFSVVGTSRCDVRAACSGTTPSNASVARIFVPPATTRAGTAQRAIPTIALNTYPIRWESAGPSPRRRRRAVEGALARREGGSGFVRAGGARGSVPEDPALFL